MLRFAKVCIAIAILVAIVIWLPACSNSVPYAKAVANPETREKYIADLVKKTNPPAQLSEVVYVNTPEERERTKFTSERKEAGEKFFMVTRITITPGDRPGTIFIFDDAFKVPKGVDFISNLEHEYTHVIQENDPAFLALVEGRAMGELLKTDPDYYWLLRESITEMGAYGLQRDDSGYNGLSDRTKSNIINNYMEYYTKLWSPGNADQAFLDSLKISFYRAWMEEFLRYGKEGAYLENSKTGVRYNLPRNFQSKPLGSAPAHKLGLFYSKTESG